MNVFLGDENNRKKGTVEILSMYMDEEWHIQ